MERFDNIPETALKWHRAGKGAALATVVETWGSAPRRVGSQLAISGQGEIAGSVSGGCVEGAVVAEALDAIEEGRPVLLEYGVSDGDAFAVGLACGGTIRVLVEPVGGHLPEPLLADLVAARAARRPVAVLTGMGAGYDPVIVDPRESFASAERFPGERLVHEWPDEGVRGFGLDARTALVLLTHDPKLDDPALEEALRSEVFYIGALGSSRTHAKRVARLAEKGFSQDEIARIHGPVGLDIGAAGPAEIAVAILAEMTRVLRRGA